MIFFVDKDALTHVRHHFAHMIARPNKGDKIKLSLLKKCLKLLFDTYTLKTVLTVGFRSDFRNLSCTAQNAQSVPQSA